MSPLFCLDGEENNAPSGQPLGAFFLSHRKAPLSTMTCGEAGLLSAEGVSLSALPQCGCDPLPPVGEAVPGAPHGSEPYRPLGSEWSLLLLANLLEDRLSFFVTTRSLEISSGAQLCHPCLAHRQFDP